MEDTPQHIEPEPTQKNPERLKKVAKKTKEALGFFAMLGAGTVGVYAAIKSGDLNAVLPLQLTSADDGSILSASLAFNGFAIPAAREAYGNLRDRHQKKRAPKGFLNSRLEAEIAESSTSEDPASTE